MSNSNKHYNEDFKKQIVDLYLNGKSVTQLVNEYSLKRPTIYTWINALKPIGTNDDGTLYTKKDIETRDRRIKELEMENEILKKATAIFARKP